MDAQITFSLPINPTNPFSSIYQAPGVVNIYTTSGIPTQLGGSTQSQIGTNTVTMIAKYTSGSSVAVLFSGSFTYSM